MSKRSCEISKVFPTPFFFSPSKKETVLCQKQIIPILKKDCSHIGNSNPQEFIWGLILANTCLHRACAYLICFRLKKPKWAPASPPQPSWLPAWVSVDRDSPGTKRESESGKCLGFMYCKCSNGQLLRSKTSICFIKDGEKFFSLLSKMWTDWNSPQILACYQIEVAWRKRQKQNYRIKDPLFITNWSNFM